MGILVALTATPNADNTVWTATDGPRTPSPASPFNPDYVITPPSGKSFPKPSPDSKSVTAQDSTYPVDTVANDGYAAPPTSAVVKINPTVTPPSPNTTFGPGLTVTIHLNYSPSKPA
jgi:hypothetical protein